MLVGLLAVRFIPQGVLNQGIRSNALFFFFPNEKIKNLFHTTSRQRLHKQTDGEGDGERASVSRQQFTRSSLCYAGRNCTRNSLGKAKLLSQNEMRAEEGGSVCLLLHPAWEIDSVQRRWAQKCPSWCSGWTENQFAARCINEPGLVRRLGLLTAPHWQTTLWELNDGYMKWWSAQKRKDILFLQTEDDKHGLKEARKKWWCQPLPIRHTLPHPEVSL